jgi:hypothetical protein
MGHRDYKTTLIYADYAPRTHEQAMLEKAFAPPISPLGELFDDDAAASDDPLA